jgi:anion-transporting  ArsA/GET3 family ATPase
MLLIVNTSLLLGGGHRSPKLPKPLVEASVLIQIEEQIERATTATATKVLKQLTETASKFEDKLETTSQEVTQVSQALQRNSQEVKQAITKAAQETNQKVAEAVESVKEQVAKSALLAVESAQTGTNEKLCSLLSSVVQTREERLTKKLFKAAAKMEDSASVSALMSNARSILKHAEYAPVIEKVAKYDAAATAAFLEENGFASYAAHFKAEGYSGKELVAVEREDIDDMPEKSNLKRKSFFNFLTQLKQPLPGN